MLRERQDMLGISTAWWYNKVDRADSIVDDVLELGLDGVELEYRLTLNMYRELKPRLTTTLPVFSIHNFFPLPEGLDQGSGDLFLLSSTDPEERARAVKHTIQTIQHAHDLGAQAVVLHLGRVDMPNPGERFAKLYNSGKEQGNAMLAFIDEQRGIRQAIHKKNMDAVLLSLEELNKEAEKKQVSLGIENRYHFHEIPNFEEIGLILERFQGGRIGYWHDVGHARAQENLGIIPHNALLQAYSDQIIGIHLHDVRGLDDHLAPGQGEIDYEEIKPYFSPSVPIILELNASRVNRKELLEGIQMIRSIGM
jgi:sugar phosphate isomerase/epimerase